MTMKIENLPLEDRPSDLDKHGPIFILGCPRSGTTFLSNCVGAIPRISEFVGILAPPRLMHLIGGSDCSQIRKELLSCIRDTFWQAYWRRIYFRNEKIKDLLSRSLSIQDFFEKPSMERRLFCYKEPFLCFAVDHFAEHFPNSKFIHIIRDGRDNADSMARSYGDALSDEILASEGLSYNKVSEIGTWRRVNGFNYPWWLPESEENSFRTMSKYARYVRLWKEMTVRGRGLKMVLGDKRYFEVKYEDFVSDPIRYGNEIREFLGQPESKGFKKKLHRAFTASTMISKKNQSKERLDEAIGIAGELLAELGYLDKREQDSRSNA